MPGRIGHKKINYRESTMRTSQFLLATQKEAPSDAELISHKLMIRAGFIRKLSSGLYTWMPLGMRVLNKVSDVVRFEMDKVGAQQVCMPTIQPAELWQESGRWDLYGPMMLRIHDRNNREFCYGPTHEEVITDIMRKELNSYKQLPQTFYQVQTKFRDEIRPRFGVMRSREFLMKDAYSFHASAECLDNTYQDIKGAYNAIFTRLGLDFRVVLADSGEIGGDNSEEFHVLANSGEDTLVISSNGEYAANIERATSYLDNSHVCDAPKQEKQKVSTPDIRSVPAQAEYMGLDIKQIVKTIIVEGKDTDAVALLVRGDHEINPLKAEKLPAVKSPLTMVSEEILKKVTQCEPGFCGPLGLDIPIIADHTVLQMSDFSCGANETDFHFKGVNWNRDCKLPEAADLRFVVEGDRCPSSQGTLSFTRGVEVGHIFQLGTKYSDSMNATVLNDAGKTQPMFMGCYGIGVTRIVAAAIEQHHDEKGICLPEVMAPFQVAIVVLNPKKDEAVGSKAEALYQSLSDKGISVLLDDRKERPGVMFAEMDLIGIPHRIVISARGLADNQVEYKHRSDEEAQMFSYDQIEAELGSRLS